ncbi:MAG TPA: PQQ-binding-like beta-propeller repeat protein [Gemmataceae bacterium]|nr:PQQ-binding-like beta-propeller repeat protein [Gemmataceae bacterium]
MRFCLSVALTFVTSIPLIAADNWPAYRGPNGDGTSDAQNIPIKWSETENVRWKTAIHAKGWSSPVVWGDQVWVTTADEEGVDPKAPVPKSGGAIGAVDRVTFFAVCIDRKSGKVVHDIKLGVQEKPQYCHPFNSYASPTPAIEEARIYAHFGSLGTWAIDTTTGKPLWDRRDLKCIHFRGPGSSPIIYQNLLILILDGYDFQYVIALDKATGQTKWKTDRNIRYKDDDGDIKKAYATARVLEVGGKPQLVCPSAECTIAYDPLTGTELWRLTHGGMNGAARPIAGHGMMFLNTGHTKQLLAVKEGSLKGEVSKDAVAWTVSKGVPSRPSLLLSGDLLFLVSDEGIASAVEAKTGKVLWSERLDGEFSASPVMVGGNVYACNQSGKTFVFVAGRGFDVLAENRLSDGFMASPAVAGDALFLRTRTNLYCIGKK